MTYNPKPPVPAGAVQFVNGRVPNAAGAIAVSEFDRLSNRHVHTYASPRVPAPKYTRFDGSTLTMTNNVVNVLVLNGDATVLFPVVSTQQYTEGNFSDSLDYGSVIQQSAITADDTVEVRSASVVNNWCALIVIQDDIGAHSLNMAIPGQPFATVRQPRQTATAATYYEFRYVNYLGVWVVTVDTSAADIAFGNSRPSPSSASSNCPAYVRLMLDDVSSDSVGPNSGLAHLAIIPQAIRQEMYRRGVTSYNTVTGDSPVHVGFFGRGLAWGDRAGIIGSSYPVISGGDAGYTSVHEFGHNVDFFFLGYTKTSAEGQLGKGPMTVTIPSDAVYTFDPRSNAIAGRQVVSNASETTRQILNCSDHPAMQDMYWRSRDSFNGGNPNNILSYGMIGFGVNDQSVSTRAAQFPGQYYEWWAECFRIWCMYKSNNNLTTLDAYILNADRTLFLNTMAAIFTGYI